MIFRYFMSYCSLYLGLVTNATAPVFKRKTPRCRPMFFYGFCYKPLLAPVRFFPLGGPIWGSCSTIQDLSMT